MRINSKPFQDFVVTFSDFEHNEFSSLYKRTHTYRFNDAGSWVTWSEIEDCEQERSCLLQVSHIAKPFQGQTGS